MGPRLTASHTRREAESSQTAGPLATMLVLVLLLLLQPQPGQPLTGCAALHGREPALVEHNDSSFTFGTARFALTFDRLTLALRNLTTCAADSRAQGLLWPAGAADIRDGFSLWQLNVSDCSVAIPEGVRLDALSSHSASRSYAVAPLLPTAKRQLSLHWLGIDGGSGAIETELVDITVPVTMQPDSAQAALGATVTRRRPGTCLQALTLPNLRLATRRSSSGVDDTLFVPWMFGQAGAAASDLPGWSGLELWRHPTVASNGQLPLMPSAGGDSASMQWMAVWSNATCRSNGNSPHANTTLPAELGHKQEQQQQQPLGLYVGAHSPDARLMLMLMESGSDSTAVQFLHLPDDLGDNSTRPWTLPFDVVLAGFEGDWCVKQPPPL